MIFLIALMISYTNVGLSKVEDQKSNLNSVTSSIKDGITECSSIINGLKLCGEISGVAGLRVDIQGCEVANVNGQIHAKRNSSFKVKENQLKEENQVDRVKNAEGYKRDATKKMMEKKMKESKKEDVKKNSGEKKKNSDSFKKTMIENSILRS